MIEAKEKKVQSPSLFDLVGEFKRLYELGCDEDSEEAFLDTQSMIMECIEDKADGYCAVINHFDYGCQMIKAEEERLKRKREVIENNIKRMKEALMQALEAMEEQGIEKPEIKTALHTIKLAGNGGKQPMTVTEEKVPDSYKKIILETDKEKIRAELEAGKKLDFAELEPRGRHLTIK